MAYMRLCRGFNVYDADFVEYPIYEMTIPTNATVYPWGQGPFQAAPSISAICFDYAPENEDLSPFFPESMPRRNGDDGCIVQNDFYYVQGPSLKIPNQQAFADVPVGTKPADWDSQFFDYYKAVTTSGVYTIFDSVANTALYNNSPPAWDETAAYFHDELPVKSRFTQHFTTAAGGSFQLSVSTNTTYGYNRWECNINGNNPLGGADQVSCPRYRGDYAYGLSSGGSLAYPNRLTQSLDTPQPFLQIFVHTVYNDIDYYGYGVVTMSSIASTAHPVQANFCLFSADFWGDSIHGGSPSQEGEWGPESGRAGGDGGFDDTSDNRGDLTGTSIASSIAQQVDIVNKNLQAGGFHVYKLANGAMSQISRVLFSQSYFGLLTVSRYNPLSAILSYHLLPAVFVPLTYDGSAQTAAVKAGGYNFATDPDTPVQVPYQSIIDTVSHWHVGSVDLAPYFGAFPDFAPFTVIKLHLPYIGEIMIDTNKVMHGSLAVDYTCDVINGNVCAYVTCTDRAGHTEQVYTATGNAAYSLPIFSETQSGAAVGKLISSGVMSAVTGNAAGMLGTAAAALDAAAFGVQHSPQVHGSFGGNVGMIGDTVCWLEIIRPQWVEPANFRQLHGIPSGIAGTLEDTEASGFVQLQSIEVDGIAGATEQELEEIVKTLKAGIYIGGVTP